MKRMLKMMTTLLALGGLMAIGGCGSDEANPLPPAPTKETPITDKVTVTGNTATTTATIEAKTDTGVKALEIPFGVDIQATSGTMPTQPSIVVATPTNGGVGYVPKTSGTNLTLQGSAGAVSISIPLVNTFTVSGAGATVIIPVTNPAALTAAQVKVEIIKPDGTVLPSKMGTVSGDKKTVTVTGVNDFCFFLILPTWLTPTGSTGSTGQ